MRLPLLLLLLVQSDVELEPSHELSFALTT
jgi:hypothetical protein